MPGPMLSSGKVSYEVGATVTAPMVEIEVRS
jgi:hypothetical protein